MAEVREPATNVETIFVHWLDAIRRGDIDCLATRLAPDVVHHGIRPDLVCRGKAEVVDNVGRTAARLPPVEAIELVGAGENVVLSIRGEGIGAPAEDDGPNRGSAAIVFTLRDGAIVHIQDYTSREDALAAAGANAFRWD